MPGFTDAHLHFLSYGIGLKEIELAGVSTLGEALAAVGARATVTPAGQWLTGRGWDHTLWAGGAFPTRQDLDRVAPEHPVFLRRKCGHAGWANSRALALAGITAETPAPFGGAIDSDPVTGQPTGILKDAAMELIFRLFREPSLAEAIGAIKTAMPHAHRVGLVGVHTMEGAGSFRAFQQLQAAGELKLRVTMQVPEENLDAAIQAGLRSGFGNESLRIGGVKIFSDGALGARTAYMLEPFEGEPGNCGLPMTTTEHLREVIGKASRAGIASFVHAIGDRANREVLDAVEASRRSGEGAGLRHRIEHAPDRAPGRYAALCGARRYRLHAADSCYAGYAYRGRALGEAQRTRLRLARPAERWRRPGLRLRFARGGSERDGGHPTRLSPRRRSDGAPGANGWYAEQRLTVDEAVHAYTAGAAYASGEEAIKGSLAPGKLADLAVLSQDIFTIDPMAILETEVVGTMVGGEFVYGEDRLTG